MGWEQLRVYLCSSVVLFGVLVPSPTATASDSPEGQVNELLLGELRCSGGRYLAAMVGPNRRTQVDDARENLRFCLSESWFYLVGTI